MKSINSRAKESFERCRQMTAPAPRYSTATAPRVLPAGSDSDDDRRSLWWTSSLVSPISSPLSPATSIPRSRPPRLCSISPDHDRFRFIFTTTAYEPGLTDAGLFITKIPSLEILVRGSRWVELDPRLERRPSEPIIEKRVCERVLRHLVGLHPDRQRPRHPHRDRVHHQRLRPRDGG